MKNFLTRLVDRARGNAPRVEPLIAPQFALESATDVAQEPILESPQSAASRSQLRAQEVSAERETAANLDRNGRSSEFVRQMEVPSTSPAETTAEKLLLPPPPASAAANDLEAKIASAAIAPRIAPQRRRHSVNFTSRDRGDYVSKSPNELPNEPPIVRVTIGRIDVRAVPEAAAPKRKVSKTIPPRLTLDDYLQQRKEGTR